jgi:hypothetical protein
VYAFWTIVKKILGKCQVFKHRSPKRLRTGRKSRQHIRAAQPFHSGQPIVFSDEQQARQPGGSLPARQTTARHNNEITKGGAWDE